MLKTTIAAASLGLVLAAPAFAQQMTAQDFVTEAASGGMYEVQSSQLVLDQAQAPAEVGEFAQRMVDDHTKANEQLTTLAQQQNLEVPSELQPEEQQMLDQLQGADDQAQTYVQQQVAAHEKTVDLFQNYAEQGDNEELKQFAEQTLPTLQEHLEMAQALPGAQ
jgi:putative membrane protein